MLVANSGSSGSAVALAGPGAHDRDGLFGQRCDALLAAFAEAVDVRAGAELEVAQVRPISSLARSPVWAASRIMRVVAAADPGGLVGGIEQRVRARDR